MSTVRMRPTFLLETRLTAEEAMDRIRQLVLQDNEREDPDRDEALNKNRPDYQGQFTRNHALILIDDSKRRFWSPWMHLEVRSAEDVRHIAGRFSPHPSIWTGFIFSYLAIGVLMFFAVMFGISQQLSSQPPWAYYAIPIGLLVAITLWILSKAGQKMAHDEMEQMKLKLEECIHS